MFFARTGDERVKEGVGLRRARGRRGAFRAARGAVQRPAVVRQKACSQTVQPGRAVPSRARLGCRRFRRGGGCRRGGGYFRRCWRGVFLHRELLLLRRHCAHVNDVALGQQPRVTPLCKHTNNEGCRHNEDAQGSVGRRGLLQSNTSSLGAHRQSTTSLAPSPLEPRSSYRRGAALPALGCKNPFATDGPAALGFGAATSEMSTRGSAADDDL